MSRQSRASDEPEPCETRFSVEKERTNERSIQLVVRVKGIQLGVGAKLRAAVSLPNKPVSLANVGKIRRQG